MTFNLPLSILNISLFGSRSRNDFDRNSDLDILVVVANETGKTSPDEVVDFIWSEFGKNPSLSWYGERKIRALFSSGDLFAWHLHLEARTLAGTSLGSLIGVPSDYRSALSDIGDLQRIASHVGEKVIACSANAVFEMGILYVCARNIAMAASWRLSSPPSFGRYSPYHLPIEFPMARSTYETMLMCRMASQRGISPPNVSSQQVLEAQKAIMMWSDMIAIAVEKEELKR
ncbi:nucleotidyltransferase domain-containing protein [Brucella pituitosa]|uniref:nucleotidyltransferase family protein n=1 Tax=Brucella pituitosa TaxID=571256 RepID=UPI0020065477|nr:nucleotidyltransferase domain-containing protein [Brucella pituitosa]MCK4206221.1 nucleotidyltransferase domain-containing protein [Brucella pituitosa]